MIILFSYDKTYKRILLFLGMVSEADKERAEDSVSDSYHGPINRVYDGHDPDAYLLREVERS